MPGIFWGPGNIQPKVVMDIGTTMDVFTTFSNLAGTSNPDDVEIDGMYLSLVLLGEGRSPRQEVYYYRGRDLYAIRLGDHKAHFITQDAYVGAAERVQHDTPLLFNVEQDPSERFNIAEKYPEIIKRLEEAKRVHQDVMNPGPDLLKDRRPKHLIEEY